MPQIEHTLTTTESEFFRNSISNSEKLSTQRLSLLGQVKELELQSAALAVTIETQLSIVVKNASLPPGKLGFSPDGTKLLIETQPPPQ